MTNLSEYRRKVIQECLDKLPASAEGFDNAGEMLISCELAIEALLRPDPAEAGEPLQSARSNITPVDHGLGADAQEEAGEPYERSGEAQLVDWTPCERTLRLAAREAQRCCPKIYENGGGAAYNDGVADAVRNIESLLPKKDPAEELVMEFIGGPHDNPHIDMDARMKLFARWLFSTNKLKD